MRTIWRNIFYLNTISSLTILMILNAAPNSKLITWKKSFSWLHNGRNCFWWCSKTNLHHLVEFVVRYSSTEKHGDVTPSTMNAYFLWIQKTFVTGDMISSLRPGLFLKILEQVLFASWTTHFCSNSTVVCVARCSMYFNTWWEKTIAFENLSNWNAHGIFKQTGSDMWKSPCSADISYELSNYGSIR